MREPLGYSSENNLCGIILQDTYRIEKILGRGGFGITYLAEDQSISRLVVIKEYFPVGMVKREPKGVCPELLSPDFAEDYQKGINKFLEEARAMSALSAIPETAKVLNYFKENKTAYLVMEYIEGITLSRYMEQRELPPSFSEAAELLLPVIEAMETVHQKGLLHRDLNSENILIKENGAIKIIDFGSAREFSEDDRTKTVLVKAGYAPLEQYSRREKQGPWTDVYSLCATFYEMITGAVPQDSLSRMEKEELYPPSMYGAEITPEEEAALMKGLALDYKDRYPDMTALKKALFPELLKTPDPACESGRTGSGRRRLSAGKRAALVLCAILILIAGAGLVYVKYRIGTSVTYAGDYDRSSDKYKEFTEYITEYATGQENTDDGIRYSLSAEDARSWGEPCNARRFSRKLSAVEKYLKEEYKVLSENSREECYAEIRKYGAIVTEFCQITEYTVSAEKNQDSSEEMVQGSKTDQPENGEPVFILTVYSDLIDQDILEMSLKRTDGSECSLAAPAAGLFLLLSEYENQTAEELEKNFQETENKKAENRENVLLLYEKPDVSVLFVWRSEALDTGYRFFPYSPMDSEAGAGYLWP